MGLNECASKCNHDDNFKKKRYAKIIDQVRKTNTLVVNNISIAGEAVSGVYAAYCLLTFLRLNIENDTYHPHLFHYSVGVSVGSVIIVVILNTRFLFEEHSKKVALEYLDACLEFFDFDSIKKIFFDIGNDQTFAVGEKFNPYFLLKNLIKDGGFCVRGNLVKFLQGNLKGFKFDNTKQYFTSKPYADWLLSNRNLDNVFIVCYSGKQTKLIVFTGNRNRFLDGINFIDYEFLRPENLINAVLCSSAIPIALALQSINGRDFAVDGASAERNQYVIIQILINCSYYFSAALVFTPERLFFGITGKNGNNFLIIVNKINIQNKFENLLDFKESTIPLLTSLNSLLSVSERTRYNANQNVPLTSLFLTQPFTSEFSVGNLNNIGKDAFADKQELLMKYIDSFEMSNIKKRIPTNRVTNDNFNDARFGLNKFYKTYKEYKKDLLKFKPIVNQMINSVYLYALNPPENTTMLDKNYQPILDSSGNEEKIDLNVCYFDIFTRNLLPSRGYSGIETDLFLNNNDGYINNMQKVGAISGNILYDMTIKQSLCVFDPEQIKDESTKKLVTGLNEIVENAYKGFLGPIQS